MRASYEPTDLATLTAELASNFRSACERAGLDLGSGLPAAPAGACLCRSGHVGEGSPQPAVSNAFKYTAAGRHRGGLAPPGRGPRSTGSAGHGRGHPRGPDGQAVRAVPSRRVARRRPHAVRGDRDRAGPAAGAGPPARRRGPGARAAVGKGSTFTVTVPLGAAHLPARAWSVRADFTPTDPLYLARPHGRALRRRGAAVAPRGRGATAGVGSGGPGVPASHGPGSRSVPPHGSACSLDDNADMREYVRRLLADRYDVVVVADGAAALEAARKEVPDLILTDVMMPGPDGFAVLRALRAAERTRGLPVLLLSARAGEEARVEGLQAGADDYLDEAVQRLRTARPRTRSWTWPGSAGRRNRNGGAETSKPVRLSKASRTPSSPWTIRGCSPMSTARPSGCSTASRATSSGKSSGRRTPVSIGSEFEPVYRRVMTEKTAAAVTSFYPDHDRWYEVHVYPAADGISIYFRDVTKRKRAEAELARLTLASEQGKRRVYETALSNTADFNYASSTCKDAFSTSASAAWPCGRRTCPRRSGRTFSNSDYPPELAAHLQRQIQQVVDTKQPVKDETLYTIAFGVRVYEYDLPARTGHGRVGGSGSRIDPDVTEAASRSEETLRQQAGTAQGRRPPQGRVPRHAGARTEKPARPHPECRADPQDDEHVGRAAGRHARHDRAPAGAAPHETRRRPVGRQPDHEWKGRTSHRAARPRHCHQQGRRDGPADDRLPGPHPLGLAAARSGTAARGPRAAGPGFRQPAEQRGKIHSPARPHRAGAARQEGGEVVAAARTTARA